MKGKAYRRLLASAVDDVVVVVAQLGGVLGVGSVARHVCGLWFVVCELCVTSCVCEDCVLAVLQVE